MRPFSLFYDCAQVVVMPTWYLFSWRHCVQVICACVTVSRVPLLKRAYELKSSLSASSCSYFHQTRTVWFKLLFTHSFEVWPLELDKHSLFSIQVRRHLQQQYSYYLLALNSLYSHNRPLTLTFCTCHSHIPTQTHTYTQPSLVIWTQVCPLSSSWVCCSCHSIILTLPLLLGPHSELLFEQEQVYPALPHILVRVSQSHTFFTSLFIEVIFSFNINHFCIIPGTHMLPSVCLFYSESFTSHSRIKVTDSVK